MKMRSYNFCHTNPKNPGNNLGIFCLITGRPKLNGYELLADVVIGIVSSDAPCGGCANFRCENTVYHDV